MCIKKWAPDSELQPTAEPRARDAFGAVLDRDVLERGFSHLSVDHRAVIVLRVLPAPVDVEDELGVAVVVGGGVRGDAVDGATHLADAGGAPHSSLYTGSPWVEPVLEMFEEIADAGLKAHAPYTVNPMPIDLYSVGQDAVKRNMMLDGYPMQGRLIQVHTRLGARPLDNWSCACYVPQVGNTAPPGTATSWAESSAVNYGNSVLGMRINRMATGFEVLCAIAGKIPVFGLLTDEGRKAKWHIDVKLTKEPHWGALGGAVGTKVVEQVPYITGVEQWIGMKDGKPDLVSMGKLKAFGSSTASSGAVGLYHLENVTPEAQQQGRPVGLAEPQHGSVDVGGARPQRAVGVGDGDGLRDLTGVEPNMAVALLKPLAVLEGARGVLVPHAD